MYLLCINLNFLSFCNLCNIGLENKTECEKLSTRREVKKKIGLFYKLNVGNSPEFSYDLISPSVGETNNYNLRNRHNISQTTNIL